MMQINPQKSLELILASVCTTGLLALLPSAAQASCSTAGLVSSSSSNQEVNLTVINDSESETLELYWIDFDGQKVLYDEILPLTEYSQSTYQGHAWLLEGTDADFCGTVVMTTDSVFQVGPAPQISSTPVEPVAQSTAPPVDTPLATATATATGIDQAGIDALLEAHNRFRAEVGVPDLTWSPTLAASAQNWANQLLFEHEENISTGENIAINGSTATDVELLTRMVNGWGSEKNNNYIPNIPYRQAAAQATGIIGHYTQIVWRNTTEVGCGIATGVIRNANGSLALRNWVDAQGNPRPASSLICRYNPAGNYIDEIPY